MCGCTCVGLAMDPEQPLPLGARPWECVPALARRRLPRLYNLPFMGPTCTFLCRQAEVTMVFVQFLQKSRATQLF